MDKFLKNTGAVFLFFGVVIISAPFRAACGALAGVTTSWIFGGTIAEVFAAFGLPGLALWKVGAVLGFVSGFLTTRTEVKNAN